MAELVKPDFVAYSVRKEGKSSYWTKLGVAFKHSDGKGFNIVLSALPKDDLVLRVPMEQQPEA